MTIRTWITDIPSVECERLLRGAELGRLGVVVDGRPEIFPVNHVFDEVTHTVVFPTNAGTKLHAALDGPFVAFEVDGLEADPPSGWSVLVVGRAEEMSDADEIRRVSAQRKAIWRTGQRVQWIRIRADHTTGRRIYGPATD